MENVIRGEVKALKFHSAIFCLKLNGVMNRLFTLSCTPVCFKSCRKKSHWPSNIFSYKLGTNACSCVCAAVNVALDLTKINHQVLMTWPHAHQSLIVSFGFM